MPHPSLSSLRRRLTAFAPKFVSRKPIPVSISILQSCGSMKEFKQVHAQLIATGRIRDTYAATKMAESYAVSARDVHYACRVFDGIFVPDSYSWTTLIRGYVEAKSPERAIKVYEKMRLRGVEPNRFTFLFVLKAFGFMRPDCFECRTVHGMILKMGFCLDAFVVNGLIHLYSKCGEISSARKAFDELPVSNGVNWNTMISAYFGCGDVENGRKLFEKMPERSLGSWNAVVAGYSKLGDVETAKSFFDMMPEKDLVSWSAMISGYVQSRRAIEALQLFNEMQRARFIPDSVTVTSVLAACAQIGALQIGRWIHAYMKKQKLMNDVILRTCLMDMYAKCGCMDMASELFHSMPQRHLCSWNVMLSGLATHGQGSAALELFQEMEACKMVPDDVTFVAVLSACSHIGSVDEGWKHFNRMETEFDFKPKIEHYGCMVDILARGGQINEAIKVVRNMPMEPNIVIWGALLNACKVYGYTDISQDVLGYLHKLAPTDGGCYTLLSNMHADNHRWADVERTRKKMREMRSDNKIPGCSSVEVNGVVYEFFAEDRVHSNWVTVREVTKTLSFHSGVEGDVPSPPLVPLQIGLSCAN